MLNPVEQQSLIKQTLNEDDRASIIGRDPLARIDHLRTILLALNETLKQEEYRQWGKAA